MRHISPLFWLLLSVAPISAQQPRFALVIGRITARMQSAGTATNIIFLDACRAFPISRGTKSLTKGLAKEPYAVPDLVVAYATAPGNTATVRGENGLSLYTSQLLKHLKTPGLVLETVLKNTRRDVLDKSEGKQRPDETGNLTSDFYFFPGNPPPLTEKKTADTKPSERPVQPPNLGVRAGTDRDLDGTLDASDACPDDYGSLSANGCPDYDEDGVPNSVDKCPTLFFSKRHSRLHQPYPYWQRSSLSGQCHIQLKRSQIWRPNMLPGVHNRQRQQSVR